MSICYDAVMGAEKYSDFYSQLWDYYDRHGRHDLLWRQPDTGGYFDPYKIMVSEVMLQQTQVTRVTPKYQLFIAKYPTIQSLSNASLGDVLRIWQGLGYNRRAKFLWQAAQQVTHEYQGVMPGSAKELTQLAGVGINTAGAIMAYAYNEAEIFIETNIRTVYIHHFFSDQQNVSDSDIRSIVADTIDTESPRTFYWALMDYGSYLKQNVGNLNTVSASYKKQSTFHGSKRQIRGTVIRELSKDSRSYEQLQEIIHDERLDAVLADLQAEDLVRKQSNYYSL